MTAASRPYIRKLASSRNRRRGHAGRRAFVAVVAVAATISAALLGSTPGGGRSLLVVGDSIVVQAAQALVARRPPGTTVWVAGTLGTAPCDWTHGQLQHELALHHPTAVVLEFSGNPGLSGPAAGCVSTDTPYSEAALVTSYRVSTMELATAASRSGAVVYLAAVPARNPAVPPGTARTHPVVQHGYNGTVALNLVLASLAASPAGRADHWQYDPAGAEALGGTNYEDPAQWTQEIEPSWQLALPCRMVPLPCTGGFVRVREGGSDAIHLDTGGAGAAVLAVALERRPLAQGR